MPALEHFPAVDSDLELAFELAALADATTMRWWSPNCVASTAKADGSPVTDADIAAERALLATVREGCPGDGFLGEEVGEHPGTNGRRWIVDGIDGTRFFVAGLPTWGTLIALDWDGEIVLGVCSSPAQDRRWWASRGEGAFTSRPASSPVATRIYVSTERVVRPGRVVSLPADSALPDVHRHALERLAGGCPPDRPWSHQMLVAEGEVDVCVWFCGDIWDHAAPSIVVEEAGGRFSDHSGGTRMDTRTAIYSNGLSHDDVLAALAQDRRHHPPG